MDGQRAPRDEQVHQRLTELTEALEHAAAALCGGYQAEELYALRVGMRRIRSLLKPLTSTRARRFRKAWGGFAAVTNRARDWDVFLLAAEEVLPSEQYEQFRARNLGRAAACHEAVMELLQSAPWRRHLQEWREFLEHPHGQAEEDFPAPQSLDVAVAKGATALAAAQLSGDERAWHKLRIAVKEIRYQAESGPGGVPANAEHAELIEHCKPLQALLGSWHDCVVQLQLLEDLELTPDHERLREAIERKRAGGLEEIRHAVEGHPLFGGSGASTTRVRSNSSSGS